MAIPTDRTISPNPFESTLTLPTDFDLFGIIRGGLIVILVAYLILAIMVIKQIMMMTKIVKGSGNKFLIALAYLHLGVVAATLLFALFVL